MTDILGILLFISQVIKISRGILNLEENNCEYAPGSGPKMLVVKENLLITWYAVIKGLQ